MIMLQTAKFDVKRDEDKIREVMKELRMVSSVNWIIEKILFESELVFVIKK